MAEEKTGAEAVPETVKIEIVPSAPEQTFSLEYVEQLRADAAAKEAAAAAKETDLAAKLADAEARAKASEVGKVRSAAAALHNLPPELHEFITAEDEPGALAQAAKLAAGLKPAAGLPRSGGRAPANGSTAAAKLDDFQRLESLSKRVPSLNNRVIRG